MRSLTCLSAIGALLISANCLAQSAYMAPLVQQSMLLDIDKVNEQLAYAVGERGHVLKITQASSDSSDMTVEQLSIPSRVTLTALTHVGSQIWAVGHDATILHSADAGATWQVQLSLPELDRPFLDVLFANEREGIAIGAYGLYYRTTDGGSTWSQELHASVLPQDDIDYLDSIKSDIDFYNEELSFILPHFNRLSQRDGTLYMAGEAGLLARSSDFGLNWERMEIDYQGSFFDIQPYANGSLMAAGLRGNIFLKQSANDAFVRIPACVTSSINSIVHNDKASLLTGNNGTVLHITQSKLNSQELLPANADGCQAHVAVRKVPSDMSDAVLNAVHFKQSVVAVTTSGIKTIDVN